MEAPITVLLWIVVAVVGGGLALSAVAVILAVVVGAIAGARDGIREARRKRAV